MGHDARRDFFCACCRTINQRIAAYILVFVAVKMSNEDIQESKRSRRSRILKAHLAVISGADVGAHFELNPDAENQVGRDLVCRVVLADPLASRVHAVLYFEDDQWCVRDASSRNGTLVAGSKIREAPLNEGDVIKIGGTEMVFRNSPLQQRLPKVDGKNLSNTVVVEQVVSEDPSESAFLNSLGSKQQAADFLLLYQYAIRLLRCDNPDDVIATSLELLKERSAASVVGFLWVTDDGRLRPKQILPADAQGRVSLNEELTELVIEQNRAVQLTKDADDTTPAIDFNQAICAPLLFEKRAVGALHLYTDADEFSPEVFDFTVSVANIMSVALVRSREQARLRADHDRLIHESAAFGDLIGESPPMLSLKSKISRVAKASGCVLVRGESGAGKELVARALHKASPRVDRPMLSVNCAAIAPELMESQLFGHVKGAFTSAESDHVGWFQQADSGTLFLDEVGELSLEGQAKLLRILEGHPFLQVGGSKEITVDVRVIAATNRDLAEFVREKRFREDLYYRLSVFELHIPPLRERGEDIQRLINYFLDHFSKKHGRGNLTLSKSANEKLLGYHWPGNVRQLRNVLDSAMVMADGEHIEPDDLGLRDSGAGELDTLRIDHWEKKLIGEAMKRTAGDITAAAKLLGIGRATLYRKLEKEKDS